MSVHDGVHSQNVVQVIPQAVYKTNQTGATVNRSAFVSPAQPNGEAYMAVTFHLLVGTVTDGTHTPVVYESPDNSTWTAVAMADLIIPAENGAAGSVGAYTAAFGTLVSNTNQKVGYNGIQPYVTINTTDTGTTGAAYTVQAVLSKPRHLPV